MVCLQALSLQQFRRGNNLKRDFSQGRFVVSPYFYGPPTEEAAEATLTVYFADGTTRKLTQSLRHQPPYDQWFAILIDVDAQSLETLDFFAVDDEQTVRYHHQSGDMAAVLQWEGDFDLDLEIWSAELDFLGTSFDLGDSPDKVTGGGGGEWFVFREHRTHDFSSGSFVVSPYFAGPATDEGVIATLITIFPDGSQQVLEQTLYYQPPYDQWFAVLIDIDNQTMEVLDAFAE